MPHWPPRTQAGRRARPGAVPSPRRLPRTAGKPPPAPGPGALGQPLRESVGRRRRAARRGGAVAGRGGAVAGRVFAREREPRRGGGRRPRPRLMTSRASGAPTRPWRKPVVNCKRSCVSDFLIMSVGAVFEVCLSVKGMLSDQLLVQSYSDATRKLLW